MTAWNLFLTSWNFDPRVLLGCAALGGGCLAVSGFKFDRKTITFLFGVLTILLALISPVDRLGEDYLFSAHMLQHIMLGTVAPILLVCGFPEKIAASILKNSVVATVEKVLTYPPLVLIIVNLTFYLWHLPAFYNLTLENETVHIVEHLSFLVTGTMLWWPVFHPIKEKRLAFQKAIVYLFVAAFLNTLLGIIFTISETPYYACYAHPEDTMGALKLIREDWGLTQLADQQLGGAIMWEPTGAIFLWAVMTVLLTWFKENSEDEHG